MLLGLATGVKWSGTYFMAVFCVISVLWDAWMRHQAGYRHWFLTGVLRDGALAACTMLPTYALTYLATALAYVSTWTGWFLHPDSYMHDWARLHPGEGIQWLPESWRSFVQYHAQMWQFHTTLDAPHDYKANPLTWPLQIREAARSPRPVFARAGLAMRGGDHFAWQPAHLVARVAVRARRNRCRDLAPR